MFKVGVVFIIIFFSLPSIATPTLICNKPEEKWMKKLDFRRELIWQGYLIGTIKIVSGCYEFYGLDPLGRRIQILFDPETAKPVADRDPASLPIRN